MGPDEVGAVSVRHMQPYEAVKAYRCPGCDHEIPLGTPHVVAGRLTSATPADYRVVLDVQRFDSSFAEGATLDVAWIVTPAKGPPRNGRTFAREAAPSRDHAGIAAAHRRALEKLAREIAAAIRSG